MANVVGAIEDQPAVAVEISSNMRAASAVYTRRGDGPYLPHSLHVLAGNGQIEEIILYAPPLGAALFAAFGQAPMN